MNFISCANYEEMSRNAAAEVMGRLRNQPRMLLCAATGNSPLEMYRHLAEKAREEPDLFRELHILKLDEWVGLKDSDPASCEAYLQRELLRPLRIPAERYISFRGQSEDLEAECERIEMVLQAWGPIDCCILGLGTNGHLGFNEPDQQLSARSHVARLSEASLTHGMIAESKNKPERGITLGMTAILQSKSIILLLTGKGKEKVITYLENGKISPAVPASFLWLHPNTTCYQDAQSIGSRQEKG